MTSTPASSLPPPQPRSWWRRHWMWVVPTGCLTLLGLAAAFVAIIVGIVFGAMRSSDAYQEAFAVAVAHPSVQESLGAPIEGGFFVLGSVESSGGGSGTASLAIPISGPKAKATIYVEGRKTAGEWTYSTLVVEIKPTGERIDLTR